MLALAARSKTLSALKSLTNASPEKDLINESVGGRTTASAAKEESQRVSLHLLTAFMCNLVIV